MSFLKIKFLDDVEMEELLDELRAEPEELDVVVDGSGGAAKRQKGSVKRAPTAYNLFYKKERMRILEREEKAPSFGEMNGLISEAWKRQTRRQLGEYHDQAAEAKWHWEAQNGVATKTGARAASSRRSEQVPRAWGEAVPPAVSRSESDMLSP